MSEELLTKKIFRLPDGSSKVTGVQVRSIIDDLGTAYKSEAKIAAAELDKASGMKLINTNLEPVKIYFDHYTMNFQI